MKKKIRNIAQIKRIFSQFTRKTSFSKNNISTKALYKTFSHSLFPNCIRDLCECFQHSLIMEVS